MVGAHSFERLVDRCRHGANVRELPPPELIALRSIGSPGIQLPLDSVQPARHGAALTFNARVNTGRVSIPPATAVLAVGERLLVSGERSSGLSAPFIEASTAAAPYRLAIGGVGDDAGAVATRVLRIGGRTPPGRRGRVQAEQGGA